MSEDLTTRVADVLRSLRTPSTAGEDLWGAFPNTMSVVDLAAAVVAALHPTIETEWCTAYYGEYPDGRKEMHLIGVGFHERKLAEAEMSDIAADDPDTRFFLVFRDYTAWRPEAGVE